MELKRAKKTLGTPKNTYPYLYLYLYLYPLPLVSAPWVTSTYTITGGPGWVSSRARLRPSPGVPFSNTKRFCY